MPFYKLPERLIALSASDEWPIAKEEWRLETVLDLTDGEDSLTCLCSHHPIRQLCYLRNSVTDNRALVGNCCVRQFMSERPDLVVSGMRRIQADLSAALSDDAVRYAYRQGWLNDFDKEFALDTQYKRKPSTRQMTWRRDINQRVLARWLAARTDT